MSFSARRLANDVLAAAKGDLFVATANDTITRLPVGADGYSVVADSSAAPGVKWWTPPSCRVYNDASIACSTGVHTTMTFNSERHNNAAIHSTSSNTSRLTAPVAGVYAIFGEISYDVNATSSERGARILLNGTDVVGYQLQPTNPVNASRVTVYTQIALAAGDYVELTAYQNCGGTLSARASNAMTAWEGIEFGMTWISAG